MYKAKVFTSTKNEKLSEKEFIFEKVAGKVEMNLIKIYEDVKYQRILGFGGAITESSGYILSQLSQENRDKIMNLYFKENGYNFIRIHIGSCDFSLNNYSNISENDDSLLTFSIEREKKYIIPALKLALSINPEIKIIASPWSPPAFMKDNNDRNYGGKLLKKYYSLWAEYIAKFIKEFEKEGIYIWGITLQNEPLAVQIWDSCIFTPEEEGDFLVNYIYPVFEKYGLLDRKILIWDHNKELVYERGKAILSNELAKKYTYGVAYHWYSGDHFDNLRIFHENFPDKILINTEATQESGISSDPWSVAKRYIHHIIGDLNNFSNGWLDWNILLDENGGPNHVKNYCDAPIIAETTKDEFYIRDHYFAIGHISRFVKEDSIRLGVSSFNSYLEITAFQNKDNVSVIISNPTDNSFNSYLIYKGEILNLTILPDSINTVIIS